MSLLPFVITGLVVGSIYSLAGVGLVLTYKTSGVFNFAQGAVATASAYLFYSLHVQLGVAWPVAALITVVGLGTLLGLGFERLARAVSTTSMVWKVTSTIGVLLCVEAVAALIYGQAQNQDVPVFLGTGSFSVGGAVVTYANLWTFLFALVVTALLYFFISHTRRGSAMRAVVHNPESS